MAAQSDARLPTDFWLRAGLRQCSAAGVPAYVRQRGDGDGAVVLKLDMGAAGCRILAQTTTMAGERGWLDVYGGATDAATAEGYIQKLRARDPDMWAVEIEHAGGWHPFDGHLV